MKKLIFLFLILLAGNANAADKYIIDSGHTNITWLIDHLGYSKTIGQFAKTEGSFVFNEQEPAKSSVEVQTDINSIQTIVPLLTQKLKGEEFFKAEKYPTAKFVSTEIKITGKKSALIKGNLTLMGVTKPVSLKAKFNKVGKQPITQRRVAGFSATAKIKRSDFGMNYGIPMVGDEVELLIEAEGILEADYLLGTN